MKEIFRFWGYSREAWENLVGPQKLIEIRTSTPSQIQSGRLRFSEEALDLLASFSEDLREGVLAYVQSSPTERVEGKVLVRLEKQDRSQSIPLVTIDGGRFRFYFDVDETLQFVQQEKYLNRRMPFFVKWGLSPDEFPRIIRKAAMASFNLSRSLLSWRKGRAAFPTLFKDFSIDVWRFLVRAVVERYATKRPEGIPLWPAGKQFAVALTHDVDTEWAFTHKNGIETFRGIEEKRGLYSVWMVVTRLASIGRPLLQNLLAAGHEIGFHGTRHDHRLAYLTKEKMSQELSRAASFLKDFDCRGFRSPGYHRTPLLYQSLSPLIQYDMTLHDAFENVISPFPSFEGCSTCFPFTIEGTGILEIPTTVNEDFFLKLKGIAPERTAEWQLGLVQKIKRREGVATILTHPEPELSASPEWIRSYDSLVAEIVKDSSAWIPLPRDLCQWWNERQRKIDSLWPRGKSLTSPLARKE